MYPGSGSDQYQYGDGGQPADGQPGYSVPVDYPPGAHPPGTYPPQPGYNQPGYQQPAYPPPPAYQQLAYPQPPHQQPAYQQPAYPQPGYDQAGYDQAGYDQAGYQQQAYPQPGYDQSGYPAGAVPPPPPRSNQGLLVGIMAGVVIIAMLSVVGVALYVVNRSDDGDPLNPQAAPSQSGAAPPPSSAAAAPPGRPADAKAGLDVGSGSVRVDVYVDYQCPPCSTFEAATAEALTGYITSKRVTLHIHPVAFIDNRSKNAYATRAAAAVACAYEAGKVLEFHSHLLRNQPAEDTAGPTDEQFIDAGRSLGLGSGFADCVSSRRLVAWVGEATSAANDYGVSSVPAAYVNSRKVTASRSELVAAITAAR
jgi:protein-disulfide isomerase